MQINKSISSLFLIASAISLKAQPQAKQPNIILFMVDDMGWQDTSVPFWNQVTPLNQRYHTPNMQRLADQGMKFTQAYACSVCSPTRISLMTGMNAARHRVTNWTLEKNASVDLKDEDLIFPKWNVNGMQPADTIENSVYATPLPQLLHDNGYYTIHCGKAHFGAIGTPSANPLTIGFDVNIAGHAAGGLGSYLGEKYFGNTQKGTHTMPWGVPGMEEFHGDSIFLTEALTQKAIKVLDKSLDTQKPFFLYMAHYAVHIPMNADKRFYQKYIDAGLPQLEASYASMIEGMDKSLGDLMDYLEKKQLTQNTIIIFMSDNGGYAASNQWRSGTLHEQNAPLNSGKGSAYEGGIREPMIVKWPGKVTPKTSCNTPVIIEDFYPTILEMAGVKHFKTIQKVDGKSIVALMSGKMQNINRPLFWHFPNKWGETGPGIGATSTIRKGDYKLVYWYKDNRYELFNISNDIGEKNNLECNEPGRVKKMASELGKYLRKVNAQRPSLKSNGQLAPWPDNKN